MACLGEAKGPSRDPPFHSFWMVGFEGADHIDLHGNPIDMSAASGHATQIHDDFERASALGLTTVRESIGWRVCAPRSHRRLDFSRMLQSADAASEFGVQVLWTLMHYGTPPDVSVTDPDFASRFADFAGAAARHLCRRTGTSSIYNPINEIGFLAWAMASGRTMRSTCTERDGYVVKTRLVQAALRGVEAIRAEDSGARFIHIEPLIHVVAPRERPELQHAAAQFCAYQWQAWDMLMGRLAPELGGSPTAVDWIGVNHYHDAQWEIGSDRPLDWCAGDARRRPFKDLLQQAWRRYGLPLVVAETSHVGAGRARWLDEIAAQTEGAMVAGVQVDGLCLYPAVDRPDWNDASHWHNSGLWDASAPGRHPAEPVTRTARHLAADYATALRRWQNRLRA